MTLFTSDTDQKLRTCAKTSLIYLLIACFFALFGGVYENFSHGVYSYSMLYAFAYPLVGGALPVLILGLSGRGRHYGGVDVTLYRCGIATLTIGSVVEGVLEIYGTGSALTVCYHWMGWGLLAAGILAGIFYGVSSQNRSRHPS